MKTIGMTNLVVIRTMIGIQRLEGIAGGEMILETVTGVKDPERQEEIALNRKGKKLS